MHKPQCNDVNTCIDQQNNIFETGLSDFHTMVVTEFKMGFQKLNLILWLTAIINALAMKSFDQTFKIVPQKKIRNALIKLFFAF